MFFAAVCMLTLTAVSLTSCGSDDDEKGYILKGTSWSGKIENKEDHSSVSSNITIKFYATSYRITAGIAIGGEGNYTMSADNKTVYMDADQGQTIGKISDDGKTMTISNTANKGVSGTLTKD